MIAAGVRSIKYSTRSGWKRALFLEMHACIGHHVQTNGQAVASVVRALMGSEGPNRALALTARLRFHNPRSVSKGVLLVIRLRVSKASLFTCLILLSGIPCLDKRSLFSVTQTAKQAFATKEVFL